MPIHPPPPGGDPRFMHGHGGPPMRYPGEQMLSPYPGANARMPMPPQGLPRNPGPPPQLGPPGGPIGPGMHRAGFRNPMPPNLPTTPLPVSAAAASPGNMGGFPLHNSQQTHRMPSVPCTTASGPVPVPGLNGPNGPIGPNGPNGHIGPNGPNGPTPATTNQQPPQRMPQMPMQRPPQPSPNMNSVGPPPPYLGNPAADHQAARMRLQSKYRMGNPNVRPQQQQPQPQQQQQQPQPPQQQPSQNLPNQVMSPQQQHQHQV